jgi:hypothetical protein
MRNNTQNRCVDTANIIYSVKLRLRNQLEYFKRLEGTRYGPCTEYVDADSVVTDDDRVVYWTIWVLDETLKYDGTKKILFKKETPLVYPRQYRTLGQYFLTAQMLRSAATPSRVITIIKNLRRLAGCWNLRSQGGIV